MISIKQKHRYWYWLYLLCLIVIASVHTLEKIMTNSGGLMSRFGPVVMVLIIGYGIYGYVNQQRLLTRGIWRTLFGCLAVLWGSASLLMVYLVFIANPSHLQALLILTFGLLIILPALIGLYRYGFACPTIWIEKQRKA